MARNAAKTLRCSRFEILSARPSFYFEDNFLKTMHIYSLADRHAVAFILSHRVLISLNELVDPLNNALQVSVHLFFRLVGKLDDHGANFLLFLILIAMLGH